MITLVLVLVAAVLVLVVVIAVLLAKLATRESVDYEAICESDDSGEMPSLTSALDPVLLQTGALAPVKFSAVPFDPMIVGPCLEQPVFRTVATERLEGIQPNMKAYNAASATMALNIDDVEVVEPPVFKTVVEASPYGEGRDPRSGRKRDKRGRFVKE